MDEDGRRFVLVRVQEIGRDMVGDQPPVTLVEPAVRHVVDVEVLGPGLALGLVEARPETLEQGLVVGRRDGRRRRVGREVGGETRILREVALAGAAGEEQEPRQGSCERPAAHPLAVVGSIIRLTSVILVAGKPLISAWRRITPSSLAM